MKAHSFGLIRIGRRRCALAVAGASFGLLYLMTATSTAPEAGAALAASPVLAHFSQGAALALWLTLPVIALWHVLRRLYDDVTFAGLLLLFPGLTLSLVGGAPGAVTATLLGGALLTLESRPLLSGVLFGLLAYRPHLAVLAIVALLLGRCWRALAATAATMLALLLVACVLFGVADWSGLAEQAWNLVRMPEAEAPVWARMPSVYAAARLVGGSALLGQSAQVVAAVGAVVVMGVIWSRRASLAWRGSALAVAFLLATPSAREDDLVVLIFPLAWLMRHMVQEESGAAQEVLVAIGWLAPAIFWVIALAGGPPTMPLLLVALALLVWRRAFPTRRLVSPEAVKAA